MRTLSPLLLLLAASLALGAADSATLPIADGPFTGSNESLAAYTCPDWFRDAKFGIWAHWGPQAVPMDGDWYARGMYEEGKGHNKYHVEHYGHPSQFGYKDIIPLWKAEHWDPERLMALYKKAGAKYFVSMGTHHDNFFLWDSKIHRWNAANMGPKKDVVALWAKAARKEGLRFGVSEHLAASFTWFQSSHRADKTGPFAGIPYDGADKAFEDLYHFPAEPGDTGWMSNNPRWQHMWYDRIHELVSNYDLDLLYSDSGVPFGNEIGRSMIAHLYNTSLKNHGAADAVYNCKEASQGKWVQDLERGVMPRIDPHPWQTDTSIGDWFYNRNWKFRPVGWIIHTLVDNVAKNGNLLLNVVQRPDGSIDPEVEQMLGEMAAWTAVNGEAIYGSRPWLVYGEGGVRYRGGSFKEDFVYSAKDIRFTTRGATLYAFAMGWPEDGKLRIRSLARPAEGGNAITRVAMLGSPGDLAFTQDGEALVVTVPAQKPCDNTWALRITGTDLKAVPVPVVFEAVKADAKGNLALGAEDAETHGEKLKVETSHGKSNIGFWDDGKEWVSWKAAIPAAGTYGLSATIATPSEGTAFRIEAGARTVDGVTVKCTDFQDYRAIDLGSVAIDQAGELTISLRAKDPAAWHALNLRTVKLTRKD